MHNFQMQVSSLRLPKWKISALFFCWLIGLLLGIAYSYRTDLLTSLMRGILMYPVSIVGLFAVTLLPYFFTALAVFVSRPGWVLFIAFGKAFCYGLCSAAVDQAYGSGGWLLRNLVLFSDVFSAPVLFWLWFGSFSGEKESILRRFLICGVLLALIFAMDIWFITPVLAMI